MKITLLLMILYCVISSFIIPKNIKISKQDSLLSLKLQVKGVEAGTLGDYEEALNNFEQLFELRKKIYGNESYRLGPILNNLGITYKNLGNLDKAIDSYKKNEKLYLANFGNDYPDLGIMYINLGNIYGLKGDLNTDLQYQENASRILQKAGIRYNDKFQISKYNIAEIQLKLGMNDKAIRYSIDNIKATSLVLIPRLYDIIALAYKNMGEFKLSEKYYLNSIKAWIELYGESNAELISEYLAYSTLLLTQKNYELAFLYSKKAKSLVPKFFGEKSIAFSEVQSNFGDYYLMRNSEAGQLDEFRTQRKKNLTQAIQYYQQAIVALSDSFQNTNPFVNPELKNILSEIQLVEGFKKKAIAMERLGDIFLSEFDTKNSIKYYDASLNALIIAAELIHRLQIGFENEDSKYFLSQNQESTYYEAIKIAYKLYSQTKNSEYIEKAFEFSERSKSSNLLASVKDMKAKEFGGIPDSLLKRENNLKNTIATYNSMLFDENHSVNPDSDKVALCNSKIFKYNEEYSKLIESFEKNYPSYYSFKYENKVTSIREVQNKISKRQALIEYFVKEPDLKSQKGELYRFLVLKDSINFLMDDIDSSYLKNIQVVHDFLTDPNYLETKKRDYKNYCISSFALYEKLFKPIENKISGKDLTIVPHNKLSYLPFDALISQKADTSGMNFRNLHYLVRDYAINYSYSATLLFDFFDQTKRTNKDLIVFSPKYVVGYPRKETESSFKYFFNPLPGAKDEVQAISRFMNEDSYIDEFAQEEVFKKKAIDYDVLHLAMHTVINDSLPMFSKLVFSEPNNSTKEDGFLNTYEIYGMKLHARLAVLSACETGTGKLQKGEGVMSMARGFIYAGCPSIVMTLWQVEDKSGVKIMEDFYRYLSKGKKKDVALRMAKLNHLNSADPLTAHPHYWLSYVNIGNPDPLYTSKDAYFAVLAIFVILFFLADWVIRKKPRKKRGF